MHFAIASEGGITARYETSPGMGSATLEDGRRVTVMNNTHFAIPCPRRLQLLLDSAGRFWVVSTECES